MDLMVWIRQICGFLILSSIFRYLLSGKQYEQYVKLFLNLLLVLLLARPLMKIDLEKTQGIWKEVSASVWESDLKKQLTDLVSADLEQEQALELLKEQLEVLIEKKGYELLDVTIEYQEDETTDLIEKISLTVSPKKDYLREPVILQENDSYTKNGNEEALGRYLEQELGLSSDISLRIEQKRQQ